MIAAIFLIVMILLFAIVILIYKYISYCRILRSHLRGLGIPYEKITGPLKSLNYAYLKDLIYEKETELAEQNYITCDNNNY